MEIMRCTVRRQLLDVDVPTLVALTYDYINVKATFSSEWAGMQKWLHIRNVEDQSIIAHVLFNNDEIGEDVGLNLSAGEWDVWIHGALYEDNTLIKRITTNVKKIRVEATGTEDEILPSIGPSVAEQAVAAAERAEAAADEAEDSAEAASGYADSAQGYADAAHHEMLDANIAANDARNSSYNSQLAATNAQNAAAAAEAAVSHYPYINAESKTWYVWDATNEEWDDTQVVAEGGTFIPSVDEYGNLSWANNAGLPNPSPVNLVSLFDDVPELQARMDEILAEAEAGVADIEEQRDTILASIASAAQLGTDTTLTTAGMAADAKATGDQIFALKDALSIENSVANFWTVGAISSTDGTNTASANSTRLRSGILTKFVCEVDSGYKYMLFGYDGTTYMGTYNGTTFVKSGNWRTTGIDTYDLPDYNYKIVFATENNDVIDETACAHIHLLSYTDPSLVYGGKAADAKVTGENINKILAAMFVANLNLAMVPRLGVGEAVDLNDVLTPGTYSIYNTASVANVSNMPIKIPGKLFITSAAGSTRIYQIYMTHSGNIYVRSNYSSWSGWQLCDELLIPPMDGSDCSEFIRFYGSHKNTIKLGPGTFKVHSVTIPEGVCIEGVGNNTILQLNSDYSTDPVLILNNGSRVKNMTIIGSGGETYDAKGGSNTLTTSHAIKIDSISGTTEADRLKIVIDGVHIAGFTGAGIYLNNTGGNINDSVSISNCHVHNCCAGIYTRNSEYHRINNSAFNGCYYGAYNGGGNNIFTGCGFNGCAIGCYIENLDNTASNNTHGTFSACTFNHEHDIAVKIIGAIVDDKNNIQSGEVFVGCHFAFGRIEVDNATGIHFAASNFLSNSPIIVGGDGFTLFSDCIFAGASHSPVTKTGTGALIFDKCYLRSGSAYNPLS